VAGLHDLQRVLAVCRHFEVPAAVCINRCDLDKDNARAIEAYCNEESVKVAAKIPFYREVTEALVQGKPVVSYTRGPRQGILLISGKVFRPTVADAATLTDRRRMKMVERRPAGGYRELSEKKRVRLISAGVKITTIVKTELPAPACWESTGWPCF